MSNYQMKKKIKKEKMNNRISLITLVLMFIGICAFGQKQVYYDTLTIKDYTTNMESERLSQLRKPIIRNFYLKNDKISYHLFKGKVAKLNPEQIRSVLEDGFSLYIDKGEHQGHKNLKPSVLEILDEAGEVAETIENVNEMEPVKLGRKIVIGSTVRFSGFTISVNEKKLGPILMDVTITE